MPVPTLTIDFASMVQDYSDKGLAQSSCYLFFEEDIVLYSQAIRELHQNSELKGKPPYRLIVDFDYPEIIDVSEDFIVEVFGYLIRSVLIYTTRSDIGFRNFPPDCKANLDNAIKLIQSRLNARTKKEKFLDCIAYKTLGSFFTQQY